MVKTEIQRSVLIVQAGEQFNSTDVQDMVEMAETSGVVGVLLDMSLVTNLNSSKIGLMIQTFRGLQSLQMYLGVTGIRPADLHILQFAGVDRLFLMFSSVQEGLNAFGQN